jgi:hypothetical protein
MDFIKENLNSRQPEIRIITSLGFAHHKKELVGKPLRFIYQEFLNNQNITWISRICNCQTYFSSWSLVTRT